MKQLLSTSPRRPIRNCPGRYILECPPHTTPAEIVGEGVQITEHRVPAARDTVIVAGIGQGGLISYRRRNGTYIHTINDEEGFRRKLLQLGIEYG